MGEAGDTTNVHEYFQEEVVRNRRTEAVTTLAEHECEC